MPMAMDSVRKLCPKGHCVLELLRRPCIGKISGNGNQRGQLASHMAVTSRDLFLNRSSVERKRSALILFTSLGMFETNFNVIALDMVQTWCFSIDELA